MLHCEKDNTQSGFALIIVLIFLQIIAMLGLYSVESVIEAEKMSRLNGQQTLVFIGAEQILNWVETKMMKAIPLCVISPIAPSELVSLPLSWWQSPQRCSGVFQLFQYYYVIEKLNIKVCVKTIPLEFSVMHHFIGEYYRITLLTLDKKNESREMLQSTIITLDNALQQCDSRDDIFLGQQMWRELR